LALDGFRHTPVAEFEALPADFEVLSKKGRDGTHWLKLRKK
jgi:hypothetical protein